MTEPEQKRKIIGELFVRVFEEEAAQDRRRISCCRAPSIPDRIESGMGGSATIKSHHNVGGLPKESCFSRTTSWSRWTRLFKDEVRAVRARAGHSRGRMVWRQPFPGPGLAVRVMGEITREKLDILRRLRRHLPGRAGKRRPCRAKIWQSFAVLTGARTVGVMGDGRTYDYCVALRAVTSDDAMTVEAAEIPYPVLEKMRSAASSPRCRTSTAWCTISPANRRERLSGNRVSGKFVRLLRRVVSIKES